MTGNPVYFTVHVTYRTPADITASSEHDDFWKPFYVKLQERKLAQVSLDEELTPGEWISRKIKEGLGERIRSEVINFFAYIPLRKLEGLSFKVVSIKRGSLLIGIAAASLGVILKEAGFGIDALREVLAGNVKDALVSLLKEVCGGVIEFIDGVFDVSIPDLNTPYAKTAVGAGVQTFSRVNFVSLMPIIYSVLSLIIVLAALVFSHMERSEVLLYWKNLVLQHEALERAQLERLIQRSVPPVRSRRTTACHASARASCGR